MNGFSEPASNSAARRDIASVVHPYTNLRLCLEKGPLVIARGEDIASDTAFFTKVLDHQAFRGGRIPTGFIETHHADLMGRILAME